MTKKQLNDIKNILIGTERTLQEISEEVRDIFNCYDPLDFSGEYDILDTGSISFDWRDEDGTIEGINVIFDVINDNVAKVIDIDII